jgi:5-(carboxyamino)imidazole ribonucleotide synthase
MRIGILGGGQLGRMFAIAARRMGYRVHAFDPTSDCPTGQIADLEVNAAYDDIDAAVRFARDVDVVTFEFENIPAETLAAIERIKPVHPSPHVLDTCRHRLHEKTFLARHGFPVAAHAPIHSAQELSRAVAQLRTPAILKTADYGYDGKGQVNIEASTDLANAWSTMGRPVGVLEAFVRFDKEISVICARTNRGETRCFDPVENAHARHILDITTVPAEISPKLARDAIDLATAIANALEVVGLLAVEMFVVADKIVVNELAPRPHNSGHFSFDACVTSQFEQQLRAVCGLPLGDPSLLKPAAMANLLGDLWSNGEPDWAAAIASDPRLKLHLYGKHTPLPGRKMGHLTAMADTAVEAREIVLRARGALVLSPWQGEG